MITVIKIRCSILRIICLSLLVMETGMLYSQIMIEGRVTYKRLPLKAAFVITEDGQSTRTDSTGYFKIELKEIGNTITVNGRRHLRTKKVKVTSTKFREIKLKKKLFQPKQKMIYGGCCFAEGTQVLIENKEIQRIEKLRRGDEVLTMNFNTLKTEIDTIVEIDSVYHENMIKLRFSNRDSLLCTGDHPIYIVGKGWASNLPKQTETNYGIETKKLKSNDICIRYSSNYNGLIIDTLYSIERITERQITYNLSTLKNNHAYFANGILVSNESIVDLHDKKWLGQFEREAKRLVMIRLAYEKQLKKGDVFYDKGNFREAYAHYSSAASICPYQKYPIEMMAAIKRGQEKRPVKVDYKKRMEEYKSGYNLQSDSTYFNGQLLFTGNKYNGTYTRYYSNGKIDWIINYKDSVKNGEQRSYYSNGAIELVKYFEKGLANGVSVSYYKNGEIKRKTTYKNDTLDGTEYTYSEYGKLRGIVDYEMGIRQGEFRYYNYLDGELETVGRYVNGRESGLIYNYYKTGELKKIFNYNDGHKEGKQVTFFKNGNIKDEENFINNKRDGEQVFRYDNGRVRVKSNWLNGRLNGVVKSYDKKGRLNTIVTYKWGEKNGVSIELDSNERIIKEEHYKDDQLDGTSRIYSKKNGKLICLSNYTMGELNGEFKEYDSTRGVLMVKKNYVMGKLDGEFVEYAYEFEVMHRNYVDGYLDGPQLYYDKEGKLLYVDYYKGGVYKKTKKK